MVLGNETGPPVFLELVDGLCLRLWNHCVDCYHFLSLFDIPTEVDVLGNGPFGDGRLRQFEDRLVTVVGVTLDILVNHEIQRRD